MKLFIQLKQLGKKKCCIEKIPINFPTLPFTVQELIETIVCWQVNEYNKRLLQSEILKYLTNAEINSKATIGKIDFNMNYNGKPTTEIEAIANALQCYKDGIFRIFLDDSELGALSSPIVLKEESTLTIIRLTMLSGRLW